MPLNRPIEVLQLEAATALRELVYTAGSDAIKVLTLKMVAAGGNNRVAIETIAKHYRKLHAMENPDCELTP